MAILKVSGIDIVIPLRSILTGVMYAKLLKINDSSEPPEDVSQNFSFIYAADFAVSLLLPTVKEGNLFLDNGR